MVAHAFNPSTGEAETDGSLGVQRQPGLQSYSRTKINREPVSKSQKLKVKIKEIEVKIKPHKDGKYTENLDTVCYYALFELFKC